MLLWVELLSSVNGMGFPVACGGQSQEKSPCGMLYLLNPDTYSSILQTLMPGKGEEISKEWGRLNEVAQVKSGAY